MSAPPLRLTHRRSPIVPRDIRHDLALRRWQLVPLVPAQATDCVAEDREVGIELHPASLLDSGEELGQLDEQEDADEDDGLRMVSTRLLVCFCVWKGEGD